MRATKSLYSPESRLFFMLRQSIFLRAILFVARLSKKWRPLMFGRWDCFFGKWHTSLEMWMVTFQRILWKLGLRKIAIFNLCIRCTVSLGNFLGPFWTLKSPFWTFSLYFWMFYRYSSPFSWFFGHFSCIYLAQFVFRPENYSTKASIRHSVQNNDSVPDVPLAGPHHFLQSAQIAARNLLQASCIINSWPADLNVPLSVKKVQK